MRWRIGRQGTGSSGSGARTSEPCMLSSHKWIDSSVWGSAAQEWGSRQRQPERPARWMRSQTCLRICLPCSAGSPCSQGICTVSVQRHMWRQHQALPSGHAYCLCAPQMHTTTRRYLPTPPLEQHARVHHMLCLCDRTHPWVALGAVVDGQSGQAIGGAGRGGAACRCSHSVGTRVLQPAPA